MLSRSPVKVRISPSWSSVSGVTGRMMRLCRWMWMRNSLSSARSPASSTVCRWSGDPCGILRSNWYSGWEFCGARFPSTRTSLPISPFCPRDPSCRGASASTRTSLSIAPFCPRDPSCLRASASTRPPSRR